MKKILKTATIYFVLAMIAGVFFREFTKFNDFTGQTVLGAMHGHLFSLGVMFFLIILAIGLSKRELIENPTFKKFYSLYNICLGGMVFKMLVRGITEVKAFELSKAVDASISGIAGLFHIGLTVALVLFFKALHKEIK